MNPAATLLVVTAHPDDESFGPGGTLARCADLGARIVLLCATRGEAGKAGDPPLCGPEDLPRVREEELRQAAAVLGIAEVRFLGYVDRQVEQADQEELTARLAQAMEEWRPAAVVTMPPGGISGHADHRAVCRATTRAFFLARRAAGLPTALYYWTLPADRIRAIRGQGPAHPLDAARTTVVDVSATLDRKIAAIRCHRTQLAEMPILAATPAAQRRFLGGEYFQRAATREGMDLFRCLS